MAETTGITWTDSTFNPWSGCTKVAPGCANCYAAVDYSVKIRGVKWGPDGNRIRKADSGWKEPLAWDRAANAAGERRRVFCASLADVFEDWQRPILDAKGIALLRCNPCGVYYQDTEEAAGEVCRCGKMKLRMDWATMNDLRCDLFRLIDNTQNLDWLLLTKRPENIRKMWHPHICTFDRDEADIEHTNYRRNIWLGTSISDQATADKAIPELLECRDLAPVLFLSVEPLVGPVDLRTGIYSDVLSGRSKSVRLSEKRGTSLEQIDWVIVGGESGHNARPCRPEWIRSIVKQCREAAVPCFVKQLGGKPVVPDLESAELMRQWGREGLSGRHVSGHGNGDYTLILKDKKGGDMSEWPEDLRVREFPKVAL